MLLFYDTETNELLAKYPVTEEAGQVFKSEGYNNRNRVSHALIKQYFAEYEIAQEFLLRMEQEQSFPIKAATVYKLGVIYPASKGQPALNSIIFVYSIYYILILFNVQCIVRFIH